MAKFIFRESFDTYNGLNSPQGVASRWVGTIGAAESSLVAGRFLGQSYQMGQKDSFFRALDESAMDCALGCSMFFTTMPTQPSATSFLSFVNADARFMCGLGIDMDGSLIFHRQSGNQGGGRNPIAQSAPNLVMPNTWNFFEIEADFTPAVGFVRVYLNGNPEPVIDVAGLTITGGDAGPARYINIGGHPTFQAGGIGTSRYDDMYVWDEPERRGPIRIESLPVNGNGEHQDFLPSTGSDNAACIDEPLPILTDYVIGTAPGQYDEYTMANLSSSAAEIFEVNLVMLGQQTGSTVRAVALGVEVDGDVSQGPDIYMGSGFARYERRMLQTPQEVPQDWTKALVDGLILRPEITV